MVYSKLTVLDSTSQTSKLSLNKLRIDILCQKWTFIFSATNVILSLKKRGVTLVGNLDA